MSLVALLRPARAALAGTTSREDLALSLTSVAVLGLAVALALVGIAGASLQLNGYGLAPSLAWPYYAGLACLPLASGVEWLRGNQARGWMIVVHVVLFVVIVWSTPLLLEGTPRFRTSYTNYGYVDPVLGGVGLLRDRFIYHNWPLFPVGMATFLRTVNVSPYAIMAAFPLAATLSYLLPLAGILRTIASSQAAREAAAVGRRAVPLSALWPAGLWTFAVFNWTSQDYFSPQSVAFLIFLCWVYVLVRVSLRQQGAVNVTDAALLVGLFTLIVLTHVLTSLEALGVLGALTISGLVRRRTLLLTCGLIFMVWQLNAAGPFFSFYADRLHASLFDISDFVEVNVRSRVTGSLEHAQIALLRMGTSAAVFALAGAATLPALLKRPWPAAVPFAIAFLVGVAIVAPASVYGGEMLIRVLLFSLPLLGGLVVIGLRRRVFRLAFLGLLTVMAPLHILTHYGNELHDYVSPGEIAGFEFVATELAPANVFGGYPAGNFLNSALLDPRNSYLSRGVTPSTLGDFRDPTLHHAWLNDHWPMYVVLSRGDEAALQLFQDRHGFIPNVRSVLNADSNFTPVYENVDFVVYRWDRPRKAELPAPAASATPAEAPVASPARWLTAASLLVVFAMVVLELSRSPTGKPVLSRGARRMTAPLVLASLAVIAVSGFRLAQIIGYLG